METLVLDSFRAAMVAGICYCLYPPNVRKALEALHDYFIKMSELEERFEVHMIRFHNNDHLT